MIEQGGRNYAQEFNIRPNLTKRAQIKKEINRKHPKKVQSLDGNETEYG